MHDDFNKFKKVQAQCDYSLLESVELLDLWNSSRNSTDAVMNRFGKQYIRLHSTDIDSLCKWVMELRESVERLDKVALQIHNTESSATSSLQHFSIYTRMIKLHAWKSYLLLHLQHPRKETLVSLQKHQVVLYIIIIIDYNNYTCITWI